MKVFLMLFLTATVLLQSCKKENTNIKITFSNNLTEGTANASGEFTISGHISSVIRLEKVLVTKEGQSTPFLIDESTAKNKTEYDFSYNITGIVANTVIVIDAYDQKGGKTTQRFLIKK